MKKLLLLMSLFLLLCPFIFAQATDGTDFPEDTTVQGVPLPPPMYGPFPQQPDNVQPAGTYPLKPVGGKLGAGVLPKCSIVSSEYDGSVGSGYWMCRTSTIGGPYLGFSMSLPRNNPGSTHALVAQYCSIYFGLKTDWGNGVHSQYWHVYPGTGTSCQDTQGSAGKVSGYVLVTWHKPTGGAIDWETLDGSGVGTDPAGHYITWTPVSITY